MKFNLERFLIAQEKVFPIALKEIKAGKKKSHWIWFIFPQLEGLGVSENSRKFAISGLAEAKAYMLNYTLGNRLVQITEVLLCHYRPLSAIVGDVDVEKIHASMTLFYLATGERCFKEVLERWFDGGLHEATCELLRGRI